MKSNLERAYFFEKPDHIPMLFAMCPACWECYPQEWICEQFETHPFLFPHYGRPDLPYTFHGSMNLSKAKPYTDDFGCTWVTNREGIVGCVVKHPLEDWSNYTDYVFPDPAVSMGLGPINWETKKNELQSIRANGGLAMGELRHGHTFLQLSDLRGYMNLMYDMADDEPLLWDLINKLEAFNTELVRRLIDCGMNMFSFPEDLGMQ